MACFHDEGKVPVTMDVLIIQVKKEIITYKESFINLNGMPSEPTEVVLLKSLMVKIMVSVSTGLGLE